MASVRVVNPDFLNRAVIRAVHGNLVAGVQQPLDLAQGAVGAVHNIAAVMISEVFDSLRMNRVGSAQVNETGGKREVRRPDDPDPVDHFHLGVIVVSGRQENVLIVGAKAQPALIGRKIDSRPVDFILVASAVVLERLRPPGAVDHADVHIVDFNLAGCRVQEHGHRVGCRVPAFPTHRAAVQDGIAVRNDVLQRVDMVSVDVTAHRLPVQLQVRGASDDQFLLDHIDGRKAGGQLGPYAVQRDAGLTRIQVQLVDVNRLAGAELCRRAVHVLAPAGQYLSAGAVIDGGHVRCNRAVVRGIGRSPFRDLVKSSADHLVRDRQDRLLQEVRRGGARKRSDRSDVENHNHGQEPGRQSETALLLHADLPFIPRC